MMRARVLLPDAVVAITLSELSSSSSSSGAESGPAAALHSDFPADDAQAQSEYSAQEARVLRLL
jgi:hypothetical protein